MARFKCPQCGRRFGSVGEMLTHTEQVHASAPPETQTSSQRSLPTRGMPEPEPGPVATERASQTGFEVEPQRTEEVGTFQRGPMEAGGEDAESEEKQSPAFGSLIALVVIAIIIILNIIGGSPE